MKDNRQKVLLLGAGPGGLAVLEMLARESSVSVVGIVDHSADAIGMKTACKLDIQAFLDVEEALKACSPCMVINMTNDEALSDFAARRVGASNVVGGSEANLFWKMITRLQAVQNSLEESQARLQAVIHNVKEGILSINPEGIIESANPALESIFGYTPNELVGKNVSILMPEPDKGQHDGYLQKYRKTGIKHVVGNYREVEAMHKNGNIFPVELNVAEMELDGHKHFVGLIRDITARREAERKLKHLALHDSLTGLPNRAMFYDRLEFILAQAQRNNSQVAVLFIDLDGFKVVNDSMGHDMGDQVLSEVGRRLKDRIRKSDVAARMGGDEFMVVLNNLQEADHVSHIAEKIIESINHPILLNERSCHVGASIGIAMYPGDADHVDDLIKAADEAMYQAKRGGKNIFHLANF